jgi:hypothetical protein
MPATESTEEDRSRLEYTRHWFVSNRLNALRHYADLVVSTRQPIGEPETLYVMAECRRLIEMLEEQHKDVSPYALLRTLANMCLHSNARSPDVVIPILEQLSAGWIAALKGGPPVAALFQQVIPQQLTHTRVRSELSALYQRMDLPDIWQDGRLWKAMVPRWHT